MQNIYTTVKITWESDKSLTSHSRYITDHFGAFTGQTTQLRVLKHQKKLVGRQDQTSVPPGLTALCYNRDAR